MRIIEQGHEILKYSNAGLIERAGRTCYKSEEKMGCTVPAGNEKPCCRTKEEGEGPECDTCPEHSSFRFVRGLVKRGHEAMVEHGTATVKFITNRGVTHELVRHRLCALAQESTRYVGYGDTGVTFIRPVWVDSIIVKDWKEYEPAAHIVSDVDAFLVSCVLAEQAYLQLLATGWKPEQAREVLPNALKTEIVVTCNYREWRHILNLRAIGTTGRPHPQMQALMLPLLREFKQLVPAVFNDLQEPPHDA